MKLNNKIEQVWLKADYCNCGQEDCTLQNHRLCAICGGVMFYGAHESVQSQRNSRGSWNVDHFIPISKSGSNNIKNLHAIHIRCNRRKGNW